jgi:hypothetical protein
MQKKHDKYWNSIIPRGEGCLCDVERILNLNNFRYFVQNKITIHSIVTIC